MVEVNFYPLAVLINNSLASYELLIRTANA